jgi:hypothetical protein
MRQFSACGRGTKMLLLTFLMLVTTQLFASHFRYGNITATRLSETSTTVTYRLNVTTAWRLGTGDPNTFTISGGNSGSVTVAMSFVTDPSGGWTNGTGTAIVTLNKTATPTRIEWSSCCKISDLVNNHDQNWDVFTILNTSAPGSTPVSTLPAIINMPVNAAAATYTIPASDPDAGSTLTYGFPSLSGPLAGQTQPGGLSINPTTGTITFNTIGKSVGQKYNAMVTVTDNNGNLIELDFIIQMVGASNPPVFDYTSTPLNGSTFNVIAGQNLSFPVRATDPDAGSSVNLSVSGLPSYITTGNFVPAMPATGNPSATTFSWTPAAAQIGNTVVLNFIATDNVGVQSTTSVTIKVVAEPAPVFISPTPGEGSIRQIVTGALHQDVITAQSSLGSNVSIAFATVPGGSLSPAVPTAGANPGTTTFSWTPTPANWGLKTLNFQATISAVPSIFSALTYKLIVNTPPLFVSSQPSVSINAGQPFSYNITVSDPDLSFGDSLDIVAASLPSWLTLVDNHNGSATLSGTPTAADGGSYLIHLDAEDIYHHGNPSEAEQEFTITVVTNKPPVAVCRPRNVATNASCQGVIAAAAFNNGSFDPDGDAISFSVSPAGPYNLGTTTVVLTVTDSKGASSSCTTTVTVIDNVPPAVTAPAPVTVNAPQGQCAASSVNLGNATAVDNCGTIRSLTNDAPSSFPIGTSVVTWTAIDAAGNVNIAYQRVTVINTTAPVIAATSAINVNNDANECGAAVSVAAPSATTFCTNSECGTDNIDSYSLGNVSGQSAKWTPWPSGSSALVSTAQAFSGSKSVQVSNFQDQLYLLGDKTSGKWTVKWKMFIPTGRTGYFNTQHFQTPGLEWGQQVQFGSTGNAALQVAGTFTTFSYPQNQWFDVEQTFDLDANQTTFNINGTAIKTWQFSSQANNAAGTKQLGGLDFFASTSNLGGIEPNLAAVPVFYIDDITFCGSSNATVAGTRSDAQPVSASYPVGTTTITWTATDPAGLSATATQTVTVTDNQAPTITAPSAITAEVNAAGCGATVNIGSPITADNCGVASVTNDAPATFAVGTTTVTWTVTDVHGNTANATQTVTVVNNFGVSINNPSVLAQGVNANTIYIGYTPASTLTLTAAPAGSLSNAYSYNWTVSGNLQVSGSNTGPSVNVTATAANSGPYVVTLTVTDGYGCTKTITRQLNVVDVRCGTKNDKVLVCQKTTSTTNPWVQICIAPSAVAAHLANGSTLGSCGATAARGVAPEVIAKANAGKVYPNPNKGVFELQLSGYTPGKVQVQVVDNYGKLISSESIMVSAATENFSFDMRSHAAGVYYVRVINDKGVKTLRMIVTK